ncbi:glycosyltransferase family 4 protein [Phocaeicola paurosaccharolyticus]|uniref:glycosyltransferase family 4 protein n=1 Tax=Phocaeicola paurosaccharolyticus TaxID=732242 RepID=UPI000468F18A|nr:glycosyltransferase family 4 protein [Phocaeicola paurosaccharolyticus]
MKIALITQYYKPEMGAPQNRLYEMVTGLKSLDNDLIVITGMPNYPAGRIFDEYNGKFSYKDNLDNVPVYRYWLYATNTKKTLKRIWNMVSFSLTALFSLKHLRKFKPDYIIVESPPLTLCLTAWLLSKVCRARLVSNISDLWPLSARELGAISGDSFTYKGLEKIESFIYKKSSICLGQSSEIVEYMSAHGANNTFLFRNGVDPSRFEGLRSNRKDYEALKIVYAGLLGYAQGIFDICKSIDFYKLGVEFHIYGAGGEQELIEQYLADNPGRGIFYHGKVTREQIPQILVDSDVALIPLVVNIYGAVPSKIYEAMAAGLPILFSGEGEGQRIIEKYNLGWVAPAKDYNKMIENIGSFMQEPKQVEEKKKNCIRCANEVFNRPKQIAGLNEYLEKKLMD